ncbi:MAG TPA: heat-shock protein Hsp70, partial [Sorangium sp.]|nr:heat-shock protein Hsp70 [Sorangium sp.]
RLWLALGRIGARVPSYASAHHAVSARSVERWMDHLLREKWEQLDTAARAAVAMCRITDDRSRDVASGTRARVIKRLEQLQVAERLLLPLKQWVPLDDIDRAEMLGDALPAGLRLAGDSATA